MAIPNRQIGWSQESNLLTMIKNNNIYGCGCGKPAPSKPKK